MDENEFLKKYGHLRPGTYDIQSLRYDRREDLFRDHNGTIKSAEERPHFELSSEEKNNLSGLLKEIRLESIDPEILLNYATKAIVGREHYKFIFTRHLSNALELIAHWGEDQGLSREDLSWLTLSEILESLNSSHLHNSPENVNALAENRRHMSEELRTLRLGYIIRGVRDIYVIPLHRSAANFVTSHRLTGRAVRVDSRTVEPQGLFQNIVCIENADPGFDWIFTRGIAGLISKFGGANSHMTIRCAELNLPAAIGVGEQIFERVVRAGQVELNCSEKIVRPTHG
jgi:hypothetical protein